MEMETDTPIDTAEAAEAARQETMQESDAPQPETPPPNASQPLALHSRQYQSS